MGLVRGVPVILLIISSSKINSRKEVTGKSSIYEFVLVSLVSQTQVNKRKRNLNIFLFVASSVCESKHLPINVKYLLVVQVLK